jgi:hypothetical protein
VDLDSTPTTQIKKKIRKQNTEKWKGRRRNYRQNKNYINILQISYGYTSEMGNAKDSKNTFL